MEIPVQFSLKAEVPGPLDSKTHGPTTGRPTGNELYVGLLRYDTTANKLIVCSEKNGENGATADVWVDAGTKVGDTSGSSGVGNYVPLTGGTMVGSLLLSTSLANGDTKALSDYNDNEAVPKSAVNKAIDDLVGGAPGALNTLQELAAEMIDPASDPATTVLANIATNTTAINTVKSSPGSQLALNNILGTYIDENGQPADHTTSDYVQNPMGRVAAGGDFPSGQDVTIANLRAKYGTLDHLISAMLKVAAVPANNPQPSGASFSRSGQGATTIDLGTEITRTFTVTMNRGSFSPEAAPLANTSGSPTDSTLIPYGALSAASFTFNGTTYAMTVSVDTTAQSMTASRAVTFTPPQLANMETSKFTATTLIGPQVRNNKGTIVAAQAENDDWEVSKVTYTVEAPVYVGAAATNTTSNTNTAKQANVSPTQKMNAGTSEAYVLNHTYTDYARFPRQPTAVRQWNEFAGTWASPLDASLWNVASGDQVVGGATVTYYTWQNTFVRQPADLKFTF
ncbi:MAG: hypothetical protein CMO44_17425 [Verrucomicrobiales bacterium]|nr:hypothetical protein [Verrucomicrobiales bacterium]